MPEILIEDNEYATMWYDVDKKMIHHQFKKFAFGDPFRNFLLKGTEAMKKYKLTKWLSDDRAVPVLHDDDMAWGRETWFPMTVKAGWKHWAIIMPEKVLGKMSLEKVIAAYSAAGLNAKYFSDPDAAMKWLDAQK